MKKIITYFSILLMSSIISLFLFEIYALLNPNLFPGYGHMSNNKINDKIKFSSDFIIAYPGEEEEDFNATFELIKNIKFINSFSFIFSPRPGTVASNLKLIDKEISKARLEKVQKQLFEHQISMNKSLENNEIDVLVENKTNESSKFFGRSEYMTSVIFDGNDKDVGNIVKVKINNSNQNTLFGECLNKSKQRVA